MLKQANKNNESFGYDNNKARREENTGVRIALAVSCSVKAACKGVGE
jgi:hypothetical protein